MTKLGIKIQKISNAVLCLAVVLGVAFFSTEAMATNSNILKIKGTLPECTYPQKRGGGACLEKQNAKSCLNTTPFSPIGNGVSSEMCARGKDWCNRNDPAPAKHKRCKNVYAGNPPKNHEGYDYSAACGTSIFAPCDGTATYNASSSTKPIRFKCDDICGKSYEFTFHHTKGSVGNGHYKKGKQIGWSGNATGYPCHMHIEIRQNGVILDPMNPGFDNEVCSCKDTEKVNRLECFNGQFVDDGSSVSSGYDTALSSAGVYANANDAGGFTASVDEDCVYATVIANYEKAGCIFCKPFRILFNTASVMAKISYDGLADAVKIVVVVAFAVWLAMSILKIISSFEIKEPRMLINLLINQSFRVLLVVLLLSAPLENILNLTLNPVFSTGLKIAQLGGGLVSGDNPAECGLKSRPATESTSNTAATNLGANAVSSFNNVKNVAEGVGDAAVSGFKLLTGQTTLMQEVIGEDEYLAVVGDDVGGLSSELGNGIICTIKSIQDQIMELFAVARVSWCLSWDNTIITFSGFDILPHLGYMITSVILFIAAFLIIMIYPFLLVDSILKMAIAIALFPAALGAFAFKVTANYLQKIWEIFINAIFTFIFLSIIILIITTIAKQYMVEIITDDIKNGIIKGFFWWGVNFAKVTFVLFLGWAVLGEAKTFADNFSNGINFGKGGIGSNVGSTFNAAVKNTVAKPLGKAAVKGSKYAGNVIKEKAGFGMRKFRAEDYENGGEEARDENGEVMTDENGNTMYKDNSFKSVAASAWNKVLDKGRTPGKRKIGKLLNEINDKLHSETKAYRSFERDDNGNVMETVTRKYADGSSEVTRSDAYGSVTEKTYADGRKKTTVTPSRAVKKITDKRGKIDNEALRAFQQNSLFTEKEKSLMIMKQLMDARMSNSMNEQLSQMRYDKNSEVVSGVDEKGEAYIKITNTNNDGSTVTYTANFSNGNETVMTSVEMLNKDGTGVSYTTDGIIQRKTEISVGENGSVVRKNMYSVSEEFSNTARYPVFSNGELSGSIPKGRVMFSQEELQEFGRQVLREGNNAYTFTEFR